VRTIVGISGSLRQGSLNSILLRTAVAMAPEGTSIEVETLAGVPLYDGDVEEREGRPRQVARLRDRVAAADGLLLVTPEYNNGIPGVAKNAIDWMSRPAKEIPDVFGDLPVALLGAGGTGGTRYSQGAWLPVLRLLGTRLWTSKTLFAARSWELFDDGELTDERTRSQLEKLVSGFAEYCETHPRQRA
jgi:chromate reductase